MSLTELEAVPSNPDAAGPGGPAGPEAAPPTGPSAPDDAFAALVRLVRAWREQGRKTYASGLKPALQQETGGFSEGQFGYATFRAFLGEGESRGLLRVQRMLDGQSMVLLPDEPAAPDAPPTRPAAGAGTDVPATGHDSPAARPAPRARLRVDVWNTFVDWHDDHDRLWDRQTARCFAFPVADGGQPAWLSDPDRFVEVRPVDQHTQITWMREWATTRPPAEKDRLLDALSPDAPRGQFRRELQHLGASAAWKAELQHRVVAHATDWARANDLPLDPLLDRRPATATHPSQTQAAARADARPGGPRNEQHPGDVDRLRALVHRAVERMTASELLALPLRAEHMLDR